MIVGKVLSGGCALVWTLAGVDEVGELGRGLLGLSGEILGDWTIGNALHSWVVGSSIVSLTGH